jgi:hypothetical protein
MSEVRSVVELGQQRPQLPARRGVGRLGQQIQKIVPVGVDRRLGVGRRRRAAVRTELVMWGERLPAVAAGPSDAVGGLVVLDQPGLPEDVVIVFGPGDVLVRSATGCSPL